MNKYKKLLIRNTFLICLIFSIVISVIFHFERYSYSKETYTQQSQQSLKLISGTLDNCFTKIQDLSILFRKDKTFIEYVESTAPTPTHRKDLSKYIASVITAMPTTNAAVFVTQPNDKHIISSSALMDTAFFAQTYGFELTDILDLTSATSNTATPTPYVFFTTNNDACYFTVAIRNETHLNGTYTLFSVYDMKKLLREVPSGTSLLISQSDSMLYCDGAFSNDQLQSIIAGNELSGYTTVATYSSMSAMYGNLNYTLIIPENLYYSHVNRHLIITAFSFFILFIISVVISRRISKKTYSPIDKLVAQVSEISTETSENEIEAISSVISLLNKKNNELDNIVKNSHSSLKEKFLNDFMHGYLPKDRMCEGIELYLPDIESLQHVCVIVLGGDSEQESAFDDTETLHSYYGVINTLLKHEFSESRLFHLTNVTPFVYGIVISYTSFDSLTTKLKNLLLNIEVDFGISLYSTISDEIIFWDKLPHVLMTTYYRHTSNRLSSVAKTVITTEEQQPFAVMYSPELENDIYTSCVRHNKDKLFSSLELLLKENFSSGSDFKEVRAQLSTLLNALCVRVSAFTGIKLEDIFGKDISIYHKMKHSKDFSEFSDNVYDVFLKISDEIKNLHSIDEHNYSEIMLEYIHQNYQRDVSLYDLATYMNMSQAYVSRLFKKLTGCNFKDYLAKIRIEKATSLLVENPFTSISEIASMVGYNNAKPFTALFNKTVGVSPSEYRKMHRSK